MKQRTGSNPDRIVLRHRRGTWLRFIKLFPQCRLPVVWVAAYIIDEYTALTIDHLVGNMAFAYSELTLDDADLEKIEAAYEKFIEDTGATPEF